ncbi:hypothetical protein [Prosthecobacter sp.]|jgi:hypothetical protein|uniref:hypothetical protein n=1 Tax=Prosthecobacter sp. TaxID=1965333 RepID=UPI0037C6DC0C
MAISSSKKAREGGMRAGRRVKMASLRRWVRGARVKGLTGRELVFELHVRRGLALRKVAKVLRLGLGEVREHWWEIRVARAALAPKRERVLPPLALRSEGDLVALRECVSVALWETVVGTFGVPEVEDAERAEVPSAPMLSVRVKALRQMARLYGVECKGRAAAAAAAVEPVGCATPEEIAEAVRERRRGS